MEPGIYRDITNEDYHKGVGLSSSGLKRLSKSPAHYKFAPVKESKAMEKGTATHCAVFEPDRFEAEYGLYPEGDGRTAEIKEARKLFDASGKIGLTAKEYADITGMAKAVREHRLASEFVTGGVAEQSVYWKQHVAWGGEETKILCKCRPDYLIELEDGEYVVVDLKTAQDARPLKFQKNAYWDYGYHISAAHYTTGLTAIFGRAPRDFVFVTVESEAPYGVIVYRASRPFLNLGFAENESLYKVYAGCMRSGQWPAYPQIIHELNLPRGA